MLLDMSTNLNTVYILGVLFLFWLSKAILLDSRRFMKDQYPPGPYAVPLFGNLFQLSMNIWLPFTEWKSKYGECPYDR